MLDGDCSINASLDGDKATNPNNKECDVIDLDDREEEKDNEEKKKKRQKLLLCGCSLKKLLFLMVLKRERVSIIRGSWL